MPPGAPADPVPPPAKGRGTGGVSTDRPDPADDPVQLVAGHRCREAGRSRRGGRPAPAGSGWWWSCRPRWGPGIRTRALRDGEVQPIKPRAGSSAEAPVSFRSPATFETSTASKLPLAVRRSIAHHPTTHCVRATAHHHDDDVPSRLAVLTVPPTVSLAPQIGRATHPAGSPNMAPAACHRTAVNLSPTPKTRVVVATSLVPLVWPRFPTGSGQGPMTAGTPCAHIRGVRRQTAEHPSKRQWRKKGTMMRRKYGLACAAALVLAIGSITVAFASSSGPGSADHRVAGHQACREGVQETQIDLARRGSAGRPGARRAQTVRDARRWVRLATSASSFA